MTVDVERTGRIGHEFIQSRSSPSGLGAISGQRSRPHLACMYVCVCVPVFVPRLLAVALSYMGQVPVPSCLPWDLFVSILLGGLANNRARLMGIPPRQRPSHHTPSLSLPRSPTTPTHVYGEHGTHGRTADTKIQKEGPPGWTTRAAVSPSAPRTEAPMMSFFPLPPPNPKIYPPATLLQPPKPACLALPKLHELWTGASTSFSFPCFLPPGRGTTGER